MKNFYAETLYILENYMPYLEKVEKKLKKKKIIKEKLYRKLAYNKALDNLLSETINYPEDQNLCNQLHHLQTNVSTLKANRLEDWNEETFSEHITKLQTVIQTLQISIAPSLDPELDSWKKTDAKVKPWQRYVPLLKIGSIRIGKMKAGFVILLWFTIFVLLPVVGNLICIIIQ